ncbi:MAG: phenylalanine--tRNA ligase subunit beta, partial [Clostridia bacterium]
TGGSIADYAKVDVLDDTLCPRYAARVVDHVRVAPSPMWLRQYLHGAGMRSINNIVDITNFIMLETGHPMHAFDLDQVRGRHIIVRRAEEGELLRTLDGKERVLTREMLVIADEGGATGLAGVMGGLESEITDQTHTLLFECAAFDRTNIRLTSRGLGLRTEASGHFEKGVSPATAGEALARACQLVNMLDAGDVIDGVIDLYPHPKSPQVVQASCRRIAQQAGIAITPARMAEILRTLSFDVTLAGDMLTAVVPAFRQDVEGFADLAEEVLRIYGYDALGSTPLRGETVQGGLSPRMRMTNPIKRLLADMGGYEIMTYSFYGPAMLQKLNLPAEDPRMQPIRLLNPLGEDTSILRTTLAPSMLTVLSSNISYNNEAGMLFEVGASFENCKRAPGELPHEVQTLCIGLYGPHADFYALRQVVTELLRVQGIHPTLTPGAAPYYHPGRCATLHAGNCALAVLGEVHPTVVEAFDITRRVYLAEVNLEAVMALALPMGEVKPLPRFPAVTRDVALVMEESQPIGPVLDAIRTSCGDLLEEAALFDVYRGLQLAGRKSAAFSLRFRASDRTLTDEEVNRVFSQMLQTCKTAFNAQIRE